MQNNVITPPHQTANPLVRNTHEKTLEECWNELTELQHDFGRLGIVCLAKTARAIQDQLLEKDHYNNDAFLSSIASLVWKMRDYVTMSVGRGEIQIELLTRVAYLNIALDIALSENLTVQ